MVEVLTPSQEYTTPVASLPESEYGSERFWSYKKISLVLACITVGTITGGLVGYELATIPQIPSILFNIEDSRLLVSLVGTAIGFSVGSNIGLNLSKS